MTSALKAQFQERLARDLAERSIPGIPAYISLWSIIIFVTDFHQAHSKVAYAAWSGLLLLSLLRLLYQLTYRRLYGYSPLLNYTLLMALVMVPAGLWGGLFTFCIMGQTADEIQLLMVIATAGLCAGAMMSFSPDQKLAISFLLVVFMPTCSGIVLFNRELTALLLMFVTYMGFNVLLLQRAHREYWNALQNEADLAAKSRQLEETTKIDALTGIYNRRHFNENLDLEWKRGSRENRFLALIMMDIDHFKHINDTYGHLAGDDCLKMVAAITKTSFKRCTDVIARYGGEEFAILLPATPLQDAANLAESLRQKIEAHRFKCDNINLNITVSLGLAGCIPVHQSPPEGLDCALRLSRDTGRRRRG